MFGFVCKPTVSELNPIQQRKSDDLQVPIGKGILVVVGWAYLFVGVGWRIPLSSLCHFSKKKSQGAANHLSSTHAGALLALYLLVVGLLLCCRGYRSLLRHFSAQRVAIRHCGRGSRGVPAAHCIGDFLCRRNNNIIFSSIGKPPAEGRHALMPLATCHMPHSCVDDRCEAPSAL